MNERYIFKTVCVERHEVLLRHNALHMIDHLRRTIHDYAAAAEAHDLWFAETRDWLLRLREDLLYIISQQVHTVFLQELVDIIELAVARLALVEATRSTVQSDHVT